MSVTAVKETACMKELLRLQVEHQRSVLQAYWVTADSVVDRMAGGEGRLTPVQKHSGGTVRLGVHVVWRRRRRHESVSDSWGIHRGWCCFTSCGWGLCFWQTEIKPFFSYMVRLTDTSRGADGLVCLVAISNHVISQKLNMVLLPWV